MDLYFYGVRGSIPSPGARTVKYGGNTPCIYLQTSEDFHLILDAGTGIIELGDRLISDNKPIYLLLSHNHWDHIQGFPFFRPAYQPGRKITIIPGITHPHEPDAILQQLSGSRFPVTAKQLAADIRIAAHDNIQDIIRLGQLRISRKMLNHPNGGCGYLIDNHRYKFAYITDNELRPPEHHYTTFKQWCDFVHGIDLLIHDAQYHPKDFPAKSGWGHSEFSQAVALAMASGVKQLCLFSHDHRRNDEHVDAILQQARAQVAAENGQLEIFAAQEQCGFSFDEN